MPAHLTIPVLYSLEVRDLQRIAGRVEKDPRIGEGDKQAARQNVAALLTILIAAQSRPLPKTTK